MQHPVGVDYQNGRPVLTDIWAVLTNNTLLAAFPHTLAGAVAVAGAFLLGIAWYHLWRRRKDGIDTSFAPAPGDSSTDLGKEGDSCYTAN